MKNSKNKISIGVIGCTASTEFILSKLLELEFVDLAVLVTLDEAVGATKSRFKNISSEQLDAFSQVVKISRFKNNDLSELLSAMQLDVIIEVGWSLKIPKHILDIPKFGTVGIHNSLLPEFHGPASLNWALIWDFNKWGCTLFYLEEDFDDGDIIYQGSFHISDSDDINTLFSKSDSVAWNLIYRFLSHLPNGKIPRVAQDKTKISRTRKRTPADGSIDWTDSTREIFNLVRALRSPYPNAFSFINGEKIKFNCAVEAKGFSGIPGTILEIAEENILVATGDGAIHLSEFCLESGSTYLPEIGDRFVE